MIHPFDYLHRSSAAHPETIAISSVEARMSFAELHDTALRFAKVFRDLGVQPGHVVAINTQPFINLVISQALFHEAAIGTELPPGYDPSTNHIVDWIVTERELKNFDPRRQLVLNQGFMNRVALSQPVYDPQTFPNEQATLRVSFSSGTTGVPKAIPVSIRCMTDRALERRHQWRLGSPYLCLLGLSAGLTFMEYYSCIAEAETFMLAGQGVQVLGQISDHDVQCVMGSPHQLAELVRNARTSSEDFSSIKTIMSAGSALPDAVAAQLHDCFNARVVATYASSEAGSTALRDVAGSTKGYAGELLGDVEVHIVDEAGQVLPDGEVGLIGIKRAHQPQQYLADPDATKQTFKDGFFYPGDTGYLIGRDLYLAGRTAEIINAAGIKIDPARLDAAALGFPGVSDAAAFSYENELGLETIAMVFVSDQVTEAQDLSRFLSRSVGESAPSVFVRAEKIPRNHMGKVNRQELAGLFSPNNGPK